MSAVVQLLGANYPTRLAATPDPPGALRVRGALPIPAADWVIGIVGARAAAGNTMALARRMAADLVREYGAVIVSGGAVGIDSAAHRGALDAGGSTVAVLAGGLDAPYPPRNRPLFDEIARAGGALVSTQPPGTRPLRRLFVARNAVIAGMCDAVVVVEAQGGSGSLHTARAAHRLGRLVAAVPGSPGCEALLASGAALVESAADLASARAGSPRAPSAPLPEAGSREARILDVLDVVKPATGAAVAAQSGLAARDAIRGLAALESDGLALLVAGQAYLLSPLAVRLRASST